jgi:hypothetical protein
VPKEAGKHPSATFDTLYGPVDDTEHRSSRKSRRILEEVALGARSGEVQRGNAHGFDLRAGQHAII